MSQGTCAQCGVGFDGHCSKLYCSRRCRERAKYERQLASGQQALKTARYQADPEFRARSRARYQIKARAKGVRPLIRTEPGSECCFPDCERAAVTNRMCDWHYRRVAAVCSKCGTDFLALRGSTGKCPPCAMFDGGQSSGLKRQVAARLAREAQEASRSVYLTCEIRSADCAECGKLFTSNRRFCSEGCSDKARKRANRERYRDVYSDRTRAHHRPCRDCGVSLGYNSMNSLCEPCRSAAALVTRRLAKARRRARKFGIEYERFSPADVFDRDGWRCGICHKRISKRLKHPHPQSVSLDHIVPLAEGGPHTLANAQAAHLICNSRKRASAANDQLKLIG